MIALAKLAETAAALRSGQLDLLAYLDELCDRIEVVERQIHALLPESDRRQRLKSEALDLQARYPDHASRPPLYGIPVGVKDMFRVNEFPTQAGSQLPTALFDGPEATCVTMLRAAGALILAKTVTTEFAYFEPGITRNPCNINHTPGGSSSGSAAAVAAGFCPLALGTQTIGSIIRPAAFCGIIGFKPSYDRISTDGLIKCAKSVDTVGLFTQDAAGMLLAASLVCANWRSTDFSDSSPLPILGVPDGPYLAQASAEGLEAFEKQLVLLQEKGYTVRRVKALANIEAINSTHNRLVYAEMARVHAAWFAEYKILYRPLTVEAIRKGQSISSEELTSLRASRGELRSALESFMKQNEIDIWICPAAPGAAPEGIATTGSGMMNLPWTHAGLPAISLPAGNAANGLPLGLQCIGAFMEDERLLQWVIPMCEIVSSLEMK